MQGRLRYQAGRAIGLDRLVVGRDVATSAGHQLSAFDGGKNGQGTLRV
jgi:hypothetical protein